MHIITNDLHLLLGNDPGRSRVEQFLDLFQPHEEDEILVRDPPLARHHLAESRVTLAPRVHAANQQGLQRKR